MRTPVKPNEGWSLDFVSDQFTDGRRLRIPTIVDDCPRDCPGLLAGASLSGLSVGLPYRGAWPADDDSQR